MKSSILRLKSDLRSFPKNAFQDREVQYRLEFHPHGIEMGCRYLQDDSTRCDIYHGETEVVMIGRPTPTRLLEWVEANEQTLELILAGIEPSWDDRGNRGSTWSEEARKAFRGLVGSGVLR